MERLKRHKVSIIAFSVLAIWATFLMAQNRIATGPYGYLWRVNTETGVTAVTLTTTEVAPGLLILNPGTTATTYTTPTAANICSAFPGISIQAPGTNTNFGWSLDVRNIGTSTSTATIAAGSGVTLATGNTNTVLNAHTRKFIFVPATCGPSTPAITVYSAQDSAH